MDLTKLARVPIAKIKPSPYNPRHEAIDIDGLAASIAEVGIIEPLVLNEDPRKKGTFHVTCGSRRLAAAKVAGLTSVPAVILGNIGERGERVVSLVENLHRRDMTHIEQGEAFLALSKLGMTQMEIAEASGVTDFTVSNKLALVTKLIPEIQEMVHRDQVALVDAVALDEAVEGRAAPCPRVRPEPPQGRAEAAGAEAPYVARRDGPPQSHRAVGEGRRCAGVR